MEPTAEEVAAALNRLVDEYRDRCLWFLRQDYYPTTTEARVRVLDHIGRHGDRAAFLKAAEIGEWLSQHCSETSADS